LEKKRKKRGKRERKKRGKESEREKEREEGEREGWDGKISIINIDQWTRLLLRRKSDKIRAH